MASLTGCTEVSSETLGDKSSCPCYFHRENVSQYLLYKELDVFKRKLFAELKHNMLSKYSETMN